MMNSSCWCFGKLIIFTLVQFPFIPFMPHYCANDCVTFCNTFLQMIRFLSNHCPLISYQSVNFYRFKTWEGRTGGGMINYSRCCCKKVEHGARLYLLSGIPAPWWYFMIYLSMISPVRNISVPYSLRKYRVSQKKIIIWRLEIFFIVYNIFVHFKTTYEFHQCLSNFIKIQWI